MTPPKALPYPNFAQLLDLLHLINKGLLDYVRNQAYQPINEDFHLLHQIDKMAEQIRVVSYATHETLVRRRNGRPEADAIYGEHPTDDA